MGAAGPCGPTHCALAGPPTRAFGRVPKCANGAPNRVRGAPNWMRRRHADPSIGAMRGCAEVGAVTMMVLMLLVAMVMAMIDANFSIDACLFKAPCFLA